MIPTSSPSLDTALARSIRYFRLNVAVREGCPRHIRNSIAVMRAMTKTFGCRPSRTDAIWFDGTRAIRLNRTSR